MHTTNDSRTDLINALIITEQLLTQLHAAQELSR